MKFLCRSGTQKPSFIDVRDIGAVAARVLTEHGHAVRNYDLTGGEALDYWQAASLLSETLGCEIKYRNPGALRFLIETMRRGAPFRYALVVMGLYTSTKYGRTGHKGSGTSTRTQADLLQTIYARLPGGMVIIGPCPNS